MLANYRDISLGKYMAKLHGRWIRQKLLPALSSLTKCTQWGAGLHGGDTSLAHLQFRAYFEIALAERLCFAALFLDISTAFASLARGMVLPVDQGDEAWLRALRTFGYTDVEIEDIYDVLMATAMHECSWSSTEGLPGVIHTLKGTLAGLPLADLIYVAAMARVLYSLEHTLCQERLLHSIAVPGEANQIDFVQKQ